MTANRPPAPAQTYGVCMLKGSKWIIAADANAMIMLKRVFQRIDKAELGQCSITRTAESDKLLQWFMDLFPLELSPRDAAELHRGAEEHRAQSKLVRRILAHDYEPRAFTLAVPPRDYQRVAASMFLELGSLLLADDTGVGKTASAITALSDASTLPALIVCPPGNMPLQWREQLDRFLPGLRIFTCQGQTPRMDTSNGWPDVTICPYHLLQYWGDVLRTRIKTIVFDEVQDLRHPDTDKYKAARQLAQAALRVLGMSATPDYAYGAEYFAVLDVVRPGCLGMWEEFDREWCVGGGERRKKAVKDPVAFGYFLDQSGIRLRRTRKDVGRELPPLTIAPTKIACDPDELRRVSGKASELAQVLLRQSFGREGNFAKMRAAGELDRIMRQATGIGKAPFVAEFVRLLVENGESCVVFVHHRSVYEILEAKLGEDFAPAVYSGEETPKEKAEALRRFKNRETKILIMGLRVGSAGLDGLQHVCRTVVIAELDWSPQLHHQAISRVDRDGQTDPVTAYYLLADEGSDPTVADVCGAKRARQVPISDPNEARRPVEQVDVGRAEQLAKAYLARTRR